jgi:hypothetical protein
MGFQLAPDMVLAKTDKGHAEIAHRSAALSHELRSALIQVDGRRTVAKLLAAWSQWPGLAAALATLAEQGYVAPAGPATIGVASSAPVSPKRELVALARAVLGANAAPVIGRIERSADDLAALRAAVDAGYKLAVLTIDERQAEAFVNAARTILERDA